MAAAGADPASIGKWIKGAKADAPVAFAFAAGASAEKSFLIVDRSKSADQLLAIAKKEGGKTCCGTVFSEGSEATFRPDTALPGLSKQLQDWFKHNKITLKANVATGAEPVSDEDDEDEEADGPILFQQATIERMIRKARSNPVNFAFGMSSTVENHALGMHLRKKPEQLAMLAKRESGSSRGGSGTVTADGKDLEFHCVEDPPGGLRKGIRALFKGWGLKFKVRVFGPAGEMDELDDDELPGGEEAAYNTDNAAENAGDAANVIGNEDAANGDTDNGDADNGDAADLEQLRTRLAALFPVLKRIAETDPAKADAARAGYRDCDAALKAGNATDATRLLVALEALTGGSAAPARNPAIDALRAELASLMPALKEAAKLPDRTTPVREQWKAADEAIKAGNEGVGAAAMALLRRLATIPAAGSGQQADQQLEAVRAAWASTREVWQVANESVDSQISALQAALRASDDGTLKEIADRGLNGVTGNFRVPIMAAVADLDRAAGEAFRTAAAKALRSIEAFEKHIESDKRVAAVDENPFGVNMSVRSTLGNALSEMRRVLGMANA